MQLIIFQIKASDDVILQHITLSQFYATVKICYAFTVCSYVKKFQNLSDKNILLTLRMQQSYTCFFTVHGWFANFQEFPLYEPVKRDILYFMTSKCA